MTTHTKEMRYYVDHPGGLPTLDQMVKKGLSEEMTLSRDVQVKKEH